MIRVFIGQSYFGAGNFGDDLTLAGFLRVAERYSAEVSACTPHDRGPLERRFPHVRWLPESAREAARRDADVWLALGDTPFQLDSGPWLLDHNERERARCAALGKPMYLLGVGCESRAAAADPRSRALLATAQRVWLRDDASAAALRAAGPVARLEVGADLAHVALAAANVVPLEPGIVALLLAFERREQFDLRELELFVERREPDCTRWLLQEVRALPYLERWLLDALAPPARSRLAAMDERAQARSLDGYLAAFGAPEAVITSRYHGALVAAWRGARVLAVTRSDKLRGIADELGLRRLEAVDSHAALETALGEARAVPRPLLEAAHDRAASTCAAFFDDCIERGARARSSPAVRARRAPLRMFVGHDFFGSGNFGDELMLGAFLAAARRYPELEVTACTPYEIEGERRRFPEVRWLPDDDAACRAALAAADCWLGLGGTPFQLESGDWFLDHNERERALCAELEKPMYLLGVGCESAAAAADPRSARLLAAAAGVWMRDELSAAMVRPFADPARIRVGGDLAHLAFGGVPPPLEHGVVGLLLAFERGEQLVLAELERFIERRPPGTTRWLVQETRPLPNLERRILADLRPAARANVTPSEFDFASGTVDDYLRAFGAPDATVTSRYHGALVAAWHGSKVVVVTRSPKLRGIAEELGLRSIDRVGSHAELEAALANAVPAEREALFAARGRAERMCEEFFETIF